MLRSLFANNCIAAIRENASPHAVGCLHKVEFAIEPPMSSSSLYRFASWAVVLALALLSLVPGSVRPQTGLPGPAEHFLAYFLTAALLGAGKRGTAYRIAVAVSLSIVSGIFELLQNFVPGREAGAFDFIVSAGGAGCGVCAIAIACHYMSARKQRCD